MRLARSNEEVAAEDLAAGARVSPRDARLNRGDNRPWSPRGLIFPEATFNALLLMEIPSPAGGVLGCGANGTIRNRRGRCRLDGAAGVGHVRPAASSCSSAAFAASARARSKRCRRTRQSHRTNACGSAIGQQVIHPGAARVRAAASTSSTSRRPSAACSTDWPGYTRNGVTHGAIERTALTSGPNRRSTCRWQVP